MAGTNNKDPVLEAGKFEGEGINFRAKLIGLEDVPEARGDKMCQDSIVKLKAIKKLSKEHKQRIIVNVSLEGLKILDQGTSNIDYTHEVHRISFISRDITDSRAFGYIYGPGDGSHKFFGIKTEKAAEGLVLALRDLFQVVYDIKKKEVEVAKKQKEVTTLELTDGVIGESDDSVYQVPQNGAPVEGTESVYAVPKSNKPVEESSGGNLLDLEDQLTSIEKGIKQMNTFDSLFDTPATSPTVPSSNAWTTTPVSTIPGLPQTAQQPTGMPVTPFPATPFPAAGFSSAPFQPGLTSQVRPAGFMPAPVAGFGASPVGSASPFSLPPPPTNASFQQSTGLQPPTRQTVLPLASDPFANDPFNSSVLQTTSTMNQSNVFSTANPFGAPSSGANMFTSASGANVFPPTSGANLFPPSTVSNNDSSGWPNPTGNMLSPMKLGGDEESEKPPETNTSHDPFSDLCDIGSITKVAKTPKDLFKEKQDLPRKTLNELKAEGLTTAANPMPPPTSSQQPFGDAGLFGQPTDSFGISAPVPSNIPDQSSNDPFGIGNVPSVPTTQQASLNCRTDPFGSLDIDANKIPDLATTFADPFDTSSFLHLSNPSSHTSSLQNNLAPQEHNYQRPRPRAKKPADILNGEPSNIKKKSVLNDKDFNLPSPDEPPPPLPSDALILSKYAPKPPPRPASVTSNKPAAVSRTNSINLNNSLSVQSNLSGSSCGSDDQDNLSSLSPGSTASSSTASPVTKAIPKRRTSLSTSPEKSATAQMYSQDRLSPVLNTPSSDKNPQTNNTPVQRTPVPKPRKSLTKNLSFNSADFDPKSEFDPFSLDSFNYNNTVKDHNDNDPFLSSQPKSALKDFDSKWDAFSSDFETISFSNIKDRVKESPNNNTAPFGDPF